MAEVVERRGPASTVAWLALVISVAALIFAIIAYNRTGKDIQDSVNDAVDSIQEDAGDAGQDASDTIEEGVDTGPDGVDDGSQ